MQAILADIGNSSIKLVIADKETCQFKSSEVARLDSKLTGNALSHFLSQAKDVTLTHCFVSSVNGSILKVFLNRLQELVPGIECHVMTADDVRLRTNVESRAKLGIDRLLAAYAGTLWQADQAAGKSNQPKPLIVVDAGTAVTIDLVDANRVFAGGVIFPGAETNFRSLHRSTSDLPDVNNQFANANLNNAIGNSTESAILAGVLSAQAFAIRGIVDRIADGLDQDPIVIASGGGIDPVRSLLPDAWHYASHLVLSGVAHAANDLGLCR